MKELTIDGKTYVKATVIAEDLGYTSDYVGQLCRAGKVDAQQVGRVWYVVPDSIQGHKKTRYRSNKVKSRQAVAEYKQAMSDQPSQRTAARHIPVAHYESDESSLIPAAAKQATPAKEQTPDPEPATAPEAEPAPIKITSEKKARTYKPAEKPAIKFTGNLSVEAVESEEEKTVTTTPVPVDNERATAAASIKKPSFRQRVAVTEDAHAAAPTAVAIRKKTVTKSKQSSGKAAFLRGTTTVVVMLVVGILGMALERQVTYQQSAGVVQKTTVNQANLYDYTFINKVISFIR